MRRYLKNTKRLVRNTIIVLVLGLILLFADFFLAISSNPIIYYTTLIVAIVFGLHLWLIFV